MARRRIKGEAKGCVRTTRSRPFDIFDRFQFGSDNALFMEKVNKRGPTHVRVYQSRKEGRKGRKGGRNEAMQ
jgi:hypothetical protein